jgi:predicted RNase H-like HicB family nuclease
MNHFSAVFQRDDEWNVGHCREVPGANGQGRSRAECERNLAEAISLIFEDRGAPIDPDSIRFKQEDD